MAADDDANEGGDEIQVGKRSKLPLIFLVLGVFAVGAGAGAVGNMFAADGDPASDDGSASGDNTEEEKGSQDEAVDTAMTVIGNFTVNLRDASGRVLQMKIEVESDLESQQKVEARMAQLRDSVILLASDYSYSELEGIDGKFRLKDDIHARVNAVLEPTQVRRIYFTEFVVQ